MSNINNKQYNNDINISNIKITICCNIVCNLVQQRCSVVGVATVSSLLSGFAETLLCVYLGA